MSTPRNPILIGQAEVIDVLPPEVRTMLQRQGIYLASDSARPGFTVPLVVNADGVWSMEIDGRLDPEHFHKTVRISGPFFAPGEEIDPVTAKDAAFAAAQMDERAVMHGLADRIVGNAAPDEVGRLEVAYAVARYLGLDWPAAAQGINPADPWRGLYAPELMPKLDGVNDWSAIHPDVPHWPDDEERGIDSLITAQGFAFSVVGDEYPDEDDTDGEEFDTCAWLANWKPAAPEGEHWRLVMIQDTEDGPAAAYVRPLAMSQAGSKGDVHPDDLAVDAFAAAMKAKLAEARAKGRSGWNEDEPGMQQRLSDMLRDHVEKGDPRDVANFCMFLHQRSETIAVVVRSDAGVHAKKALAHLSNALEDLTSSPDQRPVPLIREAMWHLQQLQQLAGAAQ